MITPVLPGPQSMVSFALNRLISAWQPDQERHAETKTNPSPSPADITFFVSNPETYDYILILASLEMHTEFGSGVCLFVIPWRLQERGAQMLT